MKAPKGFGRNYFTLSAIQAYSSHMLVQQCEARVHAYSVKLSDECDNEDEEDDSAELLCASALNIPAHAGHCNCYYRRITRNRILQNPRPKLFISPYRRTDSVSSPPCIPFFNRDKMTMKQGKQ